MLPVFVLSLQRPLDSLTFDNGQQVIATKDMVIVLQLLGKVRAVQVKPKLRLIELCMASVQVAGLVLYVCFARTALSLVFFNKDAPEAVQHGNGCIALSSTFMRLLATVSRPACACVQTRDNDTSDVDVHAYSGHMQEGHHLTVSMTHNPTRHVVAGLMTAVAGVVPPYQR